MILGAFLFPLLQLKKSASYLTPKRFTISTNSQLHHDPTGFIALSIKLYNAQVIYHRLVNLTIHVYIGIFIS